MGFPESQTEASLQVLGTEPQFSESSQCSQQLSHLSLAVLSHLKQEQLLENEQQQQPPHNSGRTSLPVALWTMDRTLNCTEKDNEFSLALAIASCPIQSVSRIVKAVYISSQGSGAKSVLLENSGVVNTQSVWENPLGMCHTKMTCRPAIIPTQTISPLILFLQMSSRWGSWLALGLLSHRCALGFNINQPRDHTTAEW